MLLGAAALMHWRQRRIYLFARAPIHVRAIAVRERERRVLDLLYAEVCLLAAITVVPVH